NAIIFRDTDFQYTDVDNTIAKTTVTYDLATGEIKDADIEVNTTYNEFALGEDPGTLYDLQSVIAHEAGHFLGLAHTQRDLHGDATMYERYAPGQTQQRDLSPDDVEALCAAYPPDRPAERCEPTPRGGLAEACRDDGAGGCSLAASPARTPRGPLAALGLALAFALRRARASGASPRRGRPAAFPLAPQLGRPAAFTPAPQRGGPAAFAPAPSRIRLTAFCPAPWRVRTAAPRRPDPR
ncbi:MAG TPA: matrixin family metalloprotease, partial [Polyangiaceae bacterium]|nr:matrixin family metalloprotease [Polyangiaceae bacterium]